MDVLIRKTVVAGSSVDEDTRNVSTSPPVLVAEHVGYAGSIA